MRWTPDWRARSITVASPARLAAARFEPAPPDAGTVVCWSFSTTITLPDGGAAVRARAGRRGSRDERSGAESSGATEDCAPHSEPSRVRSRRGLSSPTALGGPGYTGVASPRQSVDQATSARSASALLGANASQSLLKYAYTSTRLRRP